VFTGQIEKSRRHKKQGGHENKTAQGFQPNGGSDSQKQKNPLTKHGFLNGAAGETSKLVTAGARRRAASVGARDGLKSII